MFVIRKNLSAREGAPANTRVNPDTGETETTMDGGATWVDDPRSDPRQNPAYLLPPVTGGNARCAAAAGMVEDVRRVVNAGIVGTGAGGIATVLITLLLIPGIGWMFLAMLLFAAVMLGFGAAALESSFTEEVYDRLLCIFYDNIDEDGRVSWAQLETIHTAVQDEWGNAVISDTIGGMFQYQREVGVTNAGSAYADPEADCACGWCEVLDFRLDDYGFVAEELDYGIEGAWTLGVGWQNTPSDNGANASSGINIFRDFGALEVTSVEVSYEDVLGVFDGGAADAFTAIILSDTGIFSRLDNPPDSFILSADETALGRFTALIRCGFGAVPPTDPGGTATITQIVIRGLGVPPEIGEPC